MKVAEAQCFLLFAAIVVSPSAVACAHPLGNEPKVSVCDLISRSDFYNGKKVLLAADLVMGPHAGYLLDERCSDKGAVKLVIDEAVQNDRGVVAMVNSVMSHHAHGRVELIGTFNKAKIDLFTGIFFIEKVPNVGVSGK